MEISLNWLEQWVDLDGLDTDKLADRLTMAGLEVDAIEHVGEDTDDIVIGRIVEIDDHPDADKLVICQVDVGDGENRQIACGATNMGEGDRVPVALPGSKPPGVDFEITARELMGVPSEGMLLSAEELQLEESSEGLMLLPDDLALGEPAFDALELRDTVLEFDLTPNRSDCLSHLGVAREVSALFDRPLEEPDRAEEPYLWLSDVTEGDAAEVADLEVRDPDGCPRYAFAVVEDVSVGPSPFWLKRRLASIGIRSVNNIVDVTNFILMDVGQPLHAFDLDELAGSEIVVRRAEEGETLEAIDHQTYELSPDDLVIADREEPVAMAGVMGGAETEVDASTSRILLECAFFDPKTVRRTSKRHGLHTDSSHRFERRIDPGGVEPYLDRALRSINGATQHLQGASEPTVLRNIALESAEGADEGWTVEVPKGLSERILGSAIDAEDVAEAFERLKFDLEETDEFYEVRVPSYRGDLDRPIDLVEEVARLFGYDEIPDELPTARMGSEHTRREEPEHAPTIRSRRERQLVERVRTRLLNAGLYEVVNLSFMAEEALDQLRVPEDHPRRDLAEVANPLKAYEQFMRTTMYPALLSNLESNRAQKVRDVPIFELGKRYYSDRERETIGVLLSGQVADHWSERREWDFFDLKGVVESAAFPFDTSSTRWREPEDDMPWFHPGIRAVWTDGESRVAEAGRLHPEIAQEMEFEGDVLLAEIAVDSLLERSGRDQSFEPFSTHPPIDRDVALTADESVSYADIEEAIEAYRDRDERFDDLVETVELFDVYRGEQLEDHERSLAFSIRYRADDRTLTEDEVAPLDEGLVDWLQAHVGVRRR